MSEFNLIPFGLHLPTSSIKDVGSVVKGMKCDCICPSCKTPLIARQGEVREWHFAHQSRADQKKTEEPCQYSFAVSLRLMLKQLFEGGAQLLLPIYRKTFCCPIPGTDEQFRKSVEVRAEQSVFFDKVEVEVERGGVVIDLVLTKGNMELLVYVTYQGRYFPEELVNSTQKAALIEFDAMTVMHMFEETEAGLYEDTLKEFLALCTVGKAWKYHPREKTINEQIQSYVADNQDTLIEEKKREHNSTRNLKSSRNGVTALKPSSKVVSDSPSSTQDNTEHKRKEKLNALRGIGESTRLIAVGSNSAKLIHGHTDQERLIGKCDSFNNIMLHRCVKCDAEWEGTSNMCPNCHEHLYTRSAF